MHRILVIPRALPVALTFLLAGCASEPPERLALFGAVTAMGGEAIARANTLRLQGEGVHGNWGQDMRPESTGQTFRVTGFTRLLDWTAGAMKMRVEQTRTPTFLFYQGPQPRTQRYGLDGAVAYSLAADGAGTRASETTARDRVVEFYQHPVVAVRLALQPSATLSNLRTEGSERLLDVAPPSGEPFTLAFDEATNRPTRVLSPGAHPIWGDVTIETRFDGYVAANGLTLPERLVTRIDGMMTSELHLSAHLLDDAVGDIGAPSGVREAPMVDERAVTVTTEEVTPGVWLLAGQSHNSAVVELSDSLLLVEAPQSEARTLAVIARARELRPGKPLTRLLVTHHHFDHTGGVRAAVSEGLAVITHPLNGPFVEALVARPHTRQPDALARKPVSLSLHTVADTEAIADSLNPITLMHIDGNPHGDALLMAYLPKQRLLIQADAFSEGLSPQPYAPNLVDVVQRRNLRIDRVVSMHGKVVPYQQVITEAAAERAASH